ncbi:SF1B family DNA helicase RecD2 [Sabulicella rubraurantiaca]|uniref:SF1B family DNA helicase RecD2 n=1 Tax=Sabulicella rubraurantiaca TaxID=2811429 RepID=UPI001A973F6B|nr:AAA family ATPase [Sabulicella rubraurantiaca]
MSRAPRLAGRGFIGRVHVEAVLHASADERFHLLRVSGEALRGLGVGALPLRCRHGAGSGVAPGMALDVEGSFVEGRDRMLLHAEVVRRVPVEETFGLEAWLRSAGIEGVGRRRAASIAAALGPGWQEGMRDPRRLAAVKGISCAVAERISTHWQEDLRRNEAQARLLGIGLSPSQARAFAARHGGAEALRVLEEDPWRACRDVAGIGFETADRMARALGFAVDDPRRLGAGCVAAAEAALGASGGTRISEMDLVAEASRLLAVAPEVVAEALQDVLDLPGPPLGVCPETGHIGLRRLEERELQVARHLRRLARGTGLMAREAAEAEIARAEAETGIRLDRDAGQFDAAASALSHGVSVITGGPGTGKTTVLRVIVRAVVNALRLPPDHYGITLAAPTGRAARQLRDATGRRAATLHQALRLGMGRGGRVYHADNPLPSDFVIVDETSMLDLEMADRLLRAVASGASLLLVGDADQLPPVGPGQVLRDVIESGAVPVTRLTRVRRTAEGVEIPLATARIREGLHPVPEGRTLLGVHLIETADGRVVERVRQLMEGRIATLGLDPATEVQILAARRHGSCGVVALNEAVKRILVPDRAGELTVGGTGFAPGDRVMAIRNDPRVDVSNGDIGTVEAVSEGGVSVLFPGRPDAVFFLREEAEHLIHARAATIHKSQGSEFEGVVVVAAEEHGRMLDRNLLYTAVSRARKAVVIVGPRSAVLRAVGTEGATRNTGLRRLLQLEARELEQHHRFLLPASPSLAWRRAGKDAPSIPSSNVRLEGI